ncbi:hypothetical protein [Phaffia rhodozyma]|uniref:Uncharacterized protein n=1 Tax=Phaffia rhodozyma TaxID=264483 RepID=A0A0F7SN43_PHARH|nr:hypothetical protein [Phaffia rhodozyma]
MFTLFHFTILALTLILSFFTQLLTQGTINLDTLLPISDWPSTSEDFPTVLLKLSACCLTHTKMGGLGNEVGLIELPAESYVDLSNSAFARDPTGPHTDLYVASSPLDRHVSTGFGREITQVKASFRPGILGSWEGGDDSPYWTEFSRFYTALKEWLGALGWWTLGWVPGGRGAWDLGARALRFGGTRRLSRGGRWGLRLVPILAEGDALIGPDFEQEEEDRREEHPQDDVGEGEEDENVYKKFLAGGYTQVNDPSEEDDPTYHPSRSSHQIRPQLRARSYSSSSSSSSSTSSSHSSSSSPAAYSDEPLSTLSMLPPSPTLPTVLLAHMTSSSSSPLTRRRFNALLPSLSVLDPASSSSTTSSSFFSSTLSPPPFSSSSPYAGQEALSLKEFVRQRREPSVTPSPSNSFSRPDAGDEPEGRRNVGY